MVKLQLQTPAETSQFAPDVLLDLGVWMFSHVGELKTSPKAVCIFKLFLKAVMSPVLNPALQGMVSLPLPIPSMSRKGF